MAETKLSILFDLFTASQKTKVLLTEAMAESPLTPTEYAIYSLIFDAGGITPTDMAERMGLPVTTLLDHLREMEARGHVSRHPNPEDGRSYLLSLSPSGLAIHDVTGDHFDRAMLRVLEHLEIDEDIVRVALQAVGEAADAALSNLRDSLARSDRN